MKSRDRKGMVREEKGIYPNWKKSCGSPCMHKIVEITASPTMPLSSQKTVPFSALFCPALQYRGHKTMLRSVCLSVCLNIPFSDLFLSLDGDNAHRRFKCTR